MTKEEVERLLRHGAYDIFNEEKAGSTDAESNDFQQADIDSILERRSKTVVHDQTGSNSGAAGGTFSKASFKAAPKTPSGKAQAEDEVDIDDPEFWSKMVGEAKVEDKGVLTTGKKRKRKQTHYSETAYDKQLDGSLLLSGSDSSDDSDSESDEWSVQDAGSESPDSNNNEEQGQPTKKLVKRKKERTKWGGSKANQWDKKDAERLLKTLQSHGYANLPWAEFLTKASIDTEKLDAEEVSISCLRQHLNILLW
jgi:chromodomain-helicase-DNA-binding protein 7